MNKFKANKVIDNETSEKGSKKDDIAKNKLKTKPPKDNISDLEENNNSESKIKVSIFDKFKLESFRKTIGLILIVFSFFLLFSFISFFFSWHIYVSDVVDLSIENSGKIFVKSDNMLYASDKFIPEIENTGYLYVLDNGVKDNNLGGKIGLFLSYFLVYKGFGIMSVLLLIMMFTIGFKIFFQRDLFPLKAFILHSFFWIYFFSTLLAFVFNPNSWGGLFDSNYLIYAGAFGYESSYLLRLYLGDIGEILFLVTVLLIYMTLNNITIVWAKNMLTLFKNNIKEQEADINETYKKDIQTKKTKTDNDFEIKRGEEPTIKDSSKINKVVTVKEDSTDLDFEVIKNTDSDKDIDLDNDDTDEDNEETDILTDEEEIPLDIEKLDENALGTEDEKSADLLIKYGPYNPKLDLPNYVFPDTSLLDEHDSDNVKITDEELIEYKNAIIVTLRNYGIEITKISATVGPTVTLYEIIPAPGIKISKIKNLEDDIALSLSALGIRIIAPIPGKGTIGIEIPKKNPEIVSMKSLIESDRFQESKFDLPIVIGKTIANQNYIADLAKMPHLLMAGATGQGKSVGLNAILVSLLYKKHPAEIKFVLVDPKKVELTLYSKIENHYLAKLPNTEDAIITDVRKVVNTLSSLCEEMDERYDLLKNAQVRNIKEYNAKFTSRKLNPNNGHRFLPYIVLVVDEFADLIMTAGKEVELPIARLAQLARAIGIHLIIATQRPSVNIITGIIKANFPARVAFRVTQKVDSRTILDTSGAEQLIGRGDMLLSMGSDIIRLQCPFVDTPEVERITEAISKQQGYPGPLMLPEVIDENDAPAEFDNSKKDAMLEDCARLIVQTQQGSTSLLQRKFQLGYNRAGRIMDQLERLGVVGNQVGSKPREVFIKDEVKLNEIINNL